MKHFQIFVILFFFLVPAFAQTETKTEVEEKAEPDTLIADEKLNVALPIISLSASDIEDDEDSQDISGLLSASKDVFVSTAGYVFGSARFRIRGLGSDNTAVLINGIGVNDMESGNAFWSTWGGLNDATRNKVIKTGITSNDYTFGGLGGATNIITRASEYRKGLKASYSAANKSYRNRVMVTWSTGLMENGLAVTISGSRRWAEEGYVEGTFYDAWAYFLSAEKVISKKHSLGVTVFGSPNKRGKQGGSTQEVYDLTGNNYYNSYWGYQNGEKRNSRVSNYHKPHMIFNHFWEINDKTKLTTGIAYSFGKGGSTALNWYDGSYPSDLDDSREISFELGGSDPRPDYYKYLPSYYDEEPDDQELYQKLLYQWQFNKEFQQINWDYFYFVNKKNLYTVDNANGGDTEVEGNRSKYIVEDRRNDHSRITLNSTLNRKVKDFLVVIGGINMDWYKGYHFKEIVDLLGGDFWVDIDNFAERDFQDPEVAQNDLNNPNRIVKEGDRFGYDYTANVNKYEGFVQGEFKFKRIDFFIAANLSNTTFWRTGNMQNGKWPDESYGDSEKQNFTNGGVKGGVVYKITGRHMVNINGIYLTRAPYFRNAYKSPRTRDQVLDNLESEEIYSADISYHYRSPFLKARITAYHSEFKNQVKNMTLYHDELRFVNYIMNDVSQLNQGIEIGLEAKLISKVYLTGVFAHGRSVHNSNPKITITADNGSELLGGYQVVDRVSYLKGRPYGGMPQTAISGGAKYRSSKYWTLGFNVNYFDNLYLKMNPDRRTSEGLGELVITDPQWDDVLQSEKMPSAFTVDLFFFKSWRIKSKYFLNISLNVSNVLNNTEFTTGGWESFRFSTEYAQLHPDDILKYGNRYFYMYGRTYFLNVGIRF